MQNIRFENPEWLLLLLLLPLLLVSYMREHRGRQGSVQFSDLGTLRRASSSLWAKLRHSLIVLKILGLGCLVTAMARCATAICRVLSLCCHTWRRPRGVVPDQRGALPAVPRLRARRRDDGEGRTGGRRAGRRSEVQTVSVQRGCSCF